MKNYIPHIFIISVSLAILLTIGALVGTFRQEPEDCVYTQSEEPIYIHSDEIRSEDMAEAALESFLQKNAKFEGTRIQKCGVAYIFSILDENDDAKYIVCTNQDIYALRLKCSSRSIITGNAGG